MPLKPAVRGEYIETETGNKISRRATILGPKHIVLAGKCVIQHDVVIHGDLVRPSSTSTSSSQSKPQPPPSSTDKSSTSTTTDATKPSTSATSSSQENPSIHLGRYVFISPGCTLHPPSRLTSASTTSSSSINSTTQVTTYYPLRISDHVFIGSNTHVRAAEIRSNVWIGANCSIGNLVIIKENVKVLDGTVLPANSVWASGCVVAGRPGRVVGEIGDAWGAAGGSTGGAGAGGIGEEGVGVKARERWALVGNKK